MIAVSAGSNTNSGTKVTTMYRSIACLLAFTLALFGTACSKSPESRIVGEWVGTDPTGDSGAIILNADGTAKMVMNNTVLDGSSAGGSLKWKLDSSKDPMHLDIVGTNAAGQSMSLPMIVRFIGESQLQVRISDNGKSRPAVFSENVDDEDPNQMILNRK
jgi:hypothetical protein